METKLALKAVILVLTNAVMLYVSRSALRDPRSHGFYRFFAWEAILVLVLVNADVWFRDPFSWHQILSWILLSLSFFLVIEGARLLRALGKPDPQRDEPHLFGIERTTELVTVGLYRFIRHPIYASLFFGVWGVFFKIPSWTGGLLALVATGFLVATAKVEESENIRYFGPAYAEYVKRTKMFIPGVL